MTVQTVTVEALNSMMELHSAVQVHADGTVIPVRNEYSPELYVEEGQSVEAAESSLRINAKITGWEFLLKYTNEYSYEYVDNHLATSILKTPGLYATARVEEMLADGDGATESVGWHWYGK